MEENKLKDLSLFELMEMRKSSPSVEIEIEIMERMLKASRNGRKYEQRKEAIKNVKKKMY